MRPSKLCIQSLESGQSPWNTSLMVLAPIPLLSLGFRPFFLAAAAYGGLIMPAWLLIVRGKLPAASAFPTAIWHAHEMLFGYTTAVIAGFLLTAVRNWTGRDTLTGGWLLGAVLLWLAGRVAMLPGLPLPLALVAALSLAFLPALAVGIGRPLLASGNRRNYPMLLIITGLWALQAVVFLDAAGLAPELGLRALRAALMVVIILILVIGGRIIPLFTRNALGVEVVAFRWASVVAIAAVAVLAAMELLGLPEPAIVAVSAMAGVATLVRGSRWGAWATRREPLLWVLHLGHAWVGVGLLLRAAVLLDLLWARSASYHGLTVGGIGVLTLGMMARVSLGHTGRPLVASRPMAVAFVLMGAAAAARVLGPLIEPLWYMRSLDLAGTLWSAALLIFLVMYTPILLRPRHA